MSSVGIPMSDLARRAMACPRWRWMPGMLTHSTHLGGFPCCPAGTPIRVDTLSALEDCVVERMFGSIAPEPSHRHPDFERLCALHDAGMEAAWARVLPDLADPATIGCLLALEAHASLQSTEYVGDGDPVNPWRWGSFKGRSEAEALVSALEGAP